MPRKKILIIGSGGREHALAWKFAQSKKVEHVFVAPGNAGTTLEQKVSNVAIDVLSIDELIQFTKSNEIDLTVVGPEAPLAAGIVDRFQAAGLAIFGPTQKAAQLESSKAFCKDFLQANNIPTATYESFTDTDKALAYLEQQHFPIVIKADGLAAGKGVIIAQDLVQAKSAVEDMLQGNRFGDAGARVVIEEFLQGVEVSFIAMVDGQHILPLATSQDHKARDDGDKGPNTGGMGAYSPAPMVDDTLFNAIMTRVIQPTVAGMAAQGTPYSGFLYAGLMISADGSFNVLEYNCRFGDPETQPILMRLQSDLLELIETALTQRLDQVTAQWDPRSALGVVLAAGGYPESYCKGDTIHGIAHADDKNTKVFHAGTKRVGDAIQTNGGRVLCVTALGDDLATAQQQAYSAVAKISWNDMFYRKDIGHRGLVTQTTSA